MADGVWIPAAGVLNAIGVALTLLFWWKGQPFTDYTPELFGRKERSIHG